MYNNDLDLHGIAVGSELELGRSRLPRTGKKGREMFARRAVPWRPGIKDTTFFNISISRMNMMNMIPTQYHAVRTDEINKPFAK